MAIYRTWLPGLAVGLLVALPALAQQPAPPVLPPLPAPRDTSFTVHSAFIKARKQYPGISVARPAVPTSIRQYNNLTYCTVGSRALHADVCQPSKKQREGYPAVLFIHGGGWRSGDRSQHLPLAQQLAARGYVTVLAEYRLSTEALYPAAVLDLLAALRWLRANAKAYNIDTARVAVWGFSAGGQLAARIATPSGDAAPAGPACYPTHSSRVQALVDVDGTLAFIHPESGEGNDSKGPSAATLWLGTSKTQRPALWEEAGALSHVSKATPPTLFINSAVARMHAGRDDFARQLAAFGTYYEVHNLSDTPHTFPLFNPWFQPTLDYTATFLDKVLKGK
ncbi:MAG: alpha/beta hydrolase [Hymenobacter sp.]|nr:MAG: alpha/beta hydrolase [Hymenobacter sp.]